MRELFNIEKIICAVCKFLTCVLWAVVMSIATAALLVPMAYEYRGYYAYGGEYVAVIGVFIVTYWLLMCFGFKRKKRKDEGRTETYEKSTQQVPERS